MKQTGNTHKEAWEDCARCGFSYPISMLVRQNGQLVCTGDGTVKCADQQGAGFHRNRVRYPRHEGEKIVPRGNEVIE